jgi:hypothetical protein
VNFEHNSGLLGLLFNGSARLKDELTFAGNLTIAAPDLRKLAAAAGAQPAGWRRLQVFLVVGADTSGGAKDVLLKNAVVQFDDIKGSGEASLNFAGANGKPRLTGTLTTGDINITPYAGAPARQPQRQRRRRLRDGARRRSISRRFAWRMRHLC